MKFVVGRVLGDQFTECEYAVLNIVELFGWGPDLIMSIYLEILAVLYTS